MIKEIFLKQFPKDMEYEVSKLYNSFEIAKNYDIISYTEEFYTPNFWKKLTNKIDGIYVFSNGVFDDSDRRQIAFVPEIYFKEYIQSEEKINKNKKEILNYFEYPSLLLKITINSKFKEYLHKDFLGSLMGLNIKRELMGDLILENGIGYIPVCEKIKDVILNNLNQIGNAPCDIQILNINDIENMPSYKYDDKIITVPSKRLDSVVSSITNMSRTKVIEPIEKGKVLVDYIEEKDKSKNIEIGSIITIRGYGKYKLFEEIGETKKGKEKLVIKKYI